MSIGRFAPSPTGDLHVGNLRTALAAWLFARSTGSAFLLRFEDLDPTARSAFAVTQQRDLALLGLDFDGPVVFQSERIDRYRDAMADLEREGLTYPCWCSRREIRDAPRAPHQSFGQYRGTCRNLSAAQTAARAATGRPPAQRLRAEAVSITITDAIGGTHTERVDDFVLRRGDGTPAYNLVVVMDDGSQGVEQVVRANDLISSTPRQAYLQDLLGFTRPTWAHVPLVFAPDGQRLAKRHGSVTLPNRLAVGDTPERVVAVLAESLGLTTSVTHVLPADLLADFSPDQIGRYPWTMSLDQTKSPW